MEDGCGKIWSKDFIFSFLGCFSLFVNFYLLLSAMPLAVKQLWDGTSSDMSLVVTIYLLGIVLLRPFSGLIADRFGKRNVSILTLALYALCTVAYLGINALIPLLIIRFIHGIFHSISTTSHAAMAIDLVPMSKKGQGIGYYGLAMSIAMVFGPALGIFIMNTYGFDLLLIISAVFALLSWILTMFITPAKKLVAQQADDKTKKRFRLSNLIEVKAVPVCIAALRFSFSYSSLISFMAVYTKGIGLGMASMYFFIVLGITIIVTRPIIGKLLDIRGPSFLMYPALISFIIGLLLISYASVFWMIILAGVVCGLAYGAIFPSLQTISIKLSPPERSGSATGTFFLFYDFGFGAGAFVLAMLVSEFGYSSMYRVVSLLVLITIAVFYYVYDRKGNRN